MSNTKDIHSSDEHKSKRPDIPLNDKKIINGWAMFDWANSAYALVITTAIFPPYFENIVDKNLIFLGMEFTNSSLYTFSVSFAYLMIALALPLLTGMADYSGRKMFFMKIFTVIGSLACISLFLFEGMDDLWIGVLGSVVAVIGFAGGQVFYNSYLPVIASEDQYDRVSAKGFSYGYVGSVILLVSNLVVIFFHESLGLEKGFATRLAFLSVGVWWIGFSQISFARLPKDNPTPFSEGILGKGYEEIKKVWKQLQDLPNTKKFLASFFFYIAGAQTVILVAAIFAAKELQMEQISLIITVLVIQIVAIGGAYLFSTISEKKGNKVSILIMLFIWISVCIVAYFVTEQNEFYAIAAVVGLVMGGIQSMSRSTYSKLIPEGTNDTASYFSFFDVVEKTAIVFGTFSFGFIDQMMGGMRNSILALIVYFIIGISILMVTKIQKPKAMA